jgi:hypothetical protein
MLTLEQVNRFDHMRSIEDPCLALGSVFGRGYAEAP